MRLRESNESLDYEQLAERVARQDAEIADLKALLAAALQRIEQLEQENAQLRKENAELKRQLAAARKNSSTSSKPPSSDIVKQKKPSAKDGKRRKRGGQPGHPKHERTPFEESEIDLFCDYPCGCCPDCGGPGQLSDAPPRILQQVEISPKPIIIREHRRQARWCPHCQKDYYAPVDEAVRKAGLVGPRLTAVIAYLKGVCHCSFSTVRKFVRDVLGISLCRGYLRKVVGKVTDSLENPYQQLLRLLPEQDVLNVDETGHKENGKRLWTWCFRAAMFALFKISPSRGSDVLIETLGREFDGILGCDYFSAYRKYMNDCDVLVQFCLAHLIRDLKFLAGHPDKRNRCYGQRVLEAVRELFAIIHRREQSSPEEFAAALTDAGDQLRTTATHHVPSTREAQNLATRFYKHGESYIRFITTPGIEPTNNLAEQAIRFVVIDRHVTQGSRSEAGQRWLERIWTVIATCSQQGRNVFLFLCESIEAFFNGTDGPHLVHNTS